MCLLYSVTFCCPPCTVGIVFKGLPDYRAVTWSVLSRSLLPLTLVYILPARGRGLHKTGFAYVLVLRAQALLYLYLKMPNRFESLARWVFYVVFLLIKGRKIITLRVSGKVLLKIRNTNTSFIFAKNYGFSFWEVFNGRPEESRIFDKGFSTYNR